MTSVRFVIGASSFIGHFRRAFTFIELCLGLAITTLVIAAMSAFCLATGTAWKASEKTQAITMLGNQAVLRIESEVRNAKLIGACNAGSSDGSATGAAVLLWKTDTNSDGFIQGNEVELIEHDPTTHTLRLYYSGQADAAGTWSYSTQFNAASTIAAFKTNRSWKPLATGIYGAIFATDGTSGTSLNPNFRFALKLMVDDSQSAGANVNMAGGEPKLMVEYGTATVRVPLAAPGN